MTGLDAESPSRLLVLGKDTLPQGVEEHLRRSNLRVEIRIAEDAGLGPDGGVTAQVPLPGPEVVVIGASSGQPLAAGAACRRLFSDSVLLFLLPADRLARVRAALPFSPSLSGAWTVDSQCSAPEIARAILDAARSRHRQRALASALEHINRRISTGAMEEPPERRIAQSERFLATLLTHAPDAILAVDGAGAVIAWNDAAVRLFGLDLDAAIGRSVLPLFPPEIAPAVAQVLARARLGDPVSRYETAILAAGRVRIEAEISLAAVKSEGGTVDSLLLIVRDVSARKRAEEALRRSEAQFHDLADSIPQLAWMARGDGWIFWFNRRWFEYTGSTVEQMEGWGWQSVHDPKELPAVLERWRAAIATGMPFEMVFPLRGADGTFRPFLTRVLPLRGPDGQITRWFGTNTDISTQRAAEEALKQLNESLEQRVRDEVEQRIRAEEALRQAQKMEALGQLSGGIAHDYNNLLHVIRNATELLQRILVGAGPEALRLLDMVRRNAERAASLTQRLLAFSRRQPLDVKPVDPNRLVAGMADLLRHALGETIALESVLAAGIWPAMTDANQLESAILNLALNARDAMPEGGKLTVETLNTFLDEAYAASHQEVTAGQYVMIAVSDNGEGMSQEVIARAFDPFFTTKEIGKGTGLGLSQVYGFVKQSGGHVTIYSEPGEGTTVKMYLPRAAGALDTRPLPQRPALPSAARHTILLVEDEDDVRTFTAQVLRELNYHVLEACDGETALQILEGEAAVDLLFTDVGLPGGMNGRQLAEEVCRRRPGVKVLYTTGYARNAIVHQGRLDAGVELLAKPFTQAELASKIRRVLEG